MEALSNTHRMTLLDDTSYPTHQETTHETDTNTDLTWIRGDTGACWDNTMMNLRSYHRIIQVSLTPRPRTKQLRPQFARTTPTTDWHKERMALETSNTAHQDAETWSRSMFSTTQAHTRQTRRKEDNPYVDKHHPTLSKRRRPVVKAWKQSRQPMPSVCYRVIHHSGPE